MIWPAHRDFVIARVLQSGGTDAIAWLRHAVPDVELAAVTWSNVRSGIADALRAVLRRGAPPRRVTA
ncbi:MAG: hypothetical protein NTV05_16265 [Acidobacteria bacterium]|nr:hypothetical protein [Acidobacteriota bacterium]